jgi:hypothetical protein
MCNLYSVTTNQEAIRALFRIIDRYEGNLPPMPCVFPDYLAPGQGRWARDGADALGDAPTTTNRRPARDQHPQHYVTALARLAEAGEPLPRSIQQLRRTRARAERPRRKRTWYGSR